MNIEWLKNKSKEKFYPISHAKAVLYDSNKTVAEEIADVEKQVTTNLLKPTLETTEKNGVTCTNNGDGTFTIDTGGGTTTTQYIFGLRFDIKYSDFTNKDLKLIGCPNGGTEATYDLELWDEVNQKTYFDFGNGVIIPKGTTITALSFVVRQGQTVSNLVFKPMVTTNLDATYDDFVPFTGMTGKLNGDVAELEKSNEGKMDKENPTGTGAFSMNRKARTEIGLRSAAEGFNCEASGASSHAEGSYTRASANASHAEGKSCRATAQASHAEGDNTTASADNSHAEGDTTTASGKSSHAEGYSTKASGPNSHAEGVHTEASGYYSHAEGLKTKASGSYSHSGGNSTIAAYKSQTAIGEYNENKEEDIFEVGNGTSNTARSNALELTKNGDLTIAGGLLDTVLSMIVDRVYKGTDLTVKFASEIANYSDEWAWIKSRVTDGNYAGIHVGDYIPITCSNGYVLNAQIAGINTYTGYGDQLVGNHIDFICKELWNDLHVMNKVNYNNGNANSPNPFLASDLNYWLNSMSGTVPNSESDPSVTTEVDYTAGGVLYYLPDKLKNQIVPKRILLPSRYTEGGVLTSDNSWAWQSTGKLWIPSEVDVCGATCWGNSGYCIGGFVQYPIFANNMNRVKIRCESKECYNWWLLSAIADNSTYFAYVDKQGYCTNYNANFTFVAAPVCFRI